jgi:hypothetical protein
MAESVARILIQAADQTGAGLTSATAKLKTFGATVDKVLGKFTGLGTQIGALFVGGAIGAGLKRTVDGLEELAVASKKTGVAVEDLAKLRFAFEQADVPVESLNKGLRFLNRTLGEAKAGNEKAARALADLGVSANDTALPAMIKIADAIAQIPDAAERATKLNEVFGKSWEDLVPGLTQGGAAIKAAGEELQKLGGVPSQKAAEAADQLNDNLNKLARSITGPLTIAVGNVVPLVDSLAQRLLAVQTAGGGFLKVLEDIGKRVGLGRLIGETRDELDGLKEDLAALRAQEAAGDFPLFGGPAKLYTEIKKTEDAIVSVEQRLVRLRERAGELQKQAPAVDVIIEGDPNAIANLTADATAASQAAQAAVPPIIVPIAVGPTGAIGSYADLQAEFARQQEGFAAGGLLRGPGTGTSDSMLARVSNGEYVVNAASTRQFLPLLQSINRMRLPRFAAGGAVSTNPTASYRFDLNGRSISGTGAAAEVTAFASELRREVLRRGRR